MYLDQIGNIVFNVIKNHKASTHHYEVDDIVFFEQVWGDTTIGFGGVGGQSFTPSIVTVIFNFDMIYVYFNERLAYTIDSLNQSVKGRELFFSDLAARDMKPLYKSGQYS